MMSGRSLIVLAVVFLFTSCKKQHRSDCFKSNGKEVKELRSPGSFTKIEINDKIEVTVFKGPEAKVEVIAGEHVIANILTEVKDNTLRISNSNKCNVVRGYKRQVRVNITVPYLYSALNNSVEKLSFDDNFTQDSIRVNAESSGDIYLGGNYAYIKAHSNGNGDLYLSGSCRKLYASLNGTNYLKAENLSVSEYAFIETLSIGDCFLNAKDLKSFEYSIYRDGNIYYRGNPAVISGFCDKASRGKLIREE